MPSSSRQTKPPPPVFDDYPNTDSFVNVFESLPQDEGVKVKEKQAVEELVHQNEEVEISNPPLPQGGDEVQPTKPYRDPFLENINSNTDGQLRLTNFLPDSTNPQVISQRSIMLSRDHRIQLFVPRRSSASNRNHNESRGVRRRQRRWARANFLLARAWRNSRTSSPQPGGNDASTESSLSSDNDNQAQLDPVDEIALEIYHRIDGGKRGTQTRPIGAILVNLIIFAFQ